MDVFDVYLNGEFVDKVFYNSSLRLTDEDVRVSLIEHDGYMPNIQVEKVVDEGGTHAAHCCEIHGCKYREDEYCPVVQGLIEQYYPCGECPYSIADAERRIKNAYIKYEKAIKEKTFVENVLSKGE